MELGNFGLKAVLSIDYALCLRSRGLMLLRHLFEYGIPAFQLSNRMKVSIAIILLTEFVPVPYLPLGLR
jgi:hypothetical protein